MLLSSSSSSFGLMNVVEHRATQKAHPFGDERTVDQAFPGAIHEKDADPFLMCDDFSMKSKGAEKDPDRFPVDWHPHRGIDVLTYLKSGIGRHGDSLGNRETYKTPGMQWMSTSSGVYHAEGGGTPKGVDNDGFQIWVNVPASKKLKDPRYGTVPPEKLPLVDMSNNTHARVLAGEFNVSSDKKVSGSFRSVQPVLIVDFEIKQNGFISFAVPEIMNNCLIYLYRGSGSIQGQSFRAKHVVRLDASSETQRVVKLEATENNEMHVFLFAGKRLNEPISWHGPIVMNTQEQLVQTFQDLKNGKFPPKRVNWNHKKISEFPKGSTNAL